MPNPKEHNPYLTDEDQESLPPPFTYAEEPIPRRAAVRLLMGGAIGLVGGGTLIGSSILSEPSEIPQQEEDPSEDHVDPRDVVEPIVRSFVEHSNVYLNRDEILATARLSPHLRYVFSIIGSDAVQLYEKRGQAIAKDSGAQVVKRDGLEYVRFTLRPTEHTQYLQSTVRDANDEIVEEVREELPQVFTTFPQRGRIALYHENELQDTATTTEIHEYINRFGFLFPEYPPFLTVRAPIYDVIKNYGVPPRNYRVISPEISLTETDATTIQDDHTRFGYIQRLLNIYEDRIYAMSSTSIDVHPIEYKPAKTLEESIAYAYLHDMSFNPQLPEYWPPSVKPYLKNFIFHAGTYSAEIDNSVAYSAVTVDSVTNVLATLLFLSQDEAMMAELRRRIMSLDRTRRKDVNPSDSHYDEIRRIIRDATRVLQTTDEAGVRENSPHLLALYDELDLDSQTLVSDSFISHPY